MSADQKAADVLAQESFAGRGHARWMTVAGANPREKGIHDAAFGHYGVTVAKVSFEHEYSHDVQYGAKLAADYAERLVACADAMKGIADPRAFAAAVAELMDMARIADEALSARGISLSRGDGLTLGAALARCGGAS